MTRFIIALLLSQMVSAVHGGGGIACDETTLQAAINAATRGATVTCRAGSWTWASPLSITKDLILLGAGVGNTVITLPAGVDGNPPANPGIDVEPDSTMSASGILKISGFTFDGADVATPFIFVNNTVPTLIITRNTFKNANPGNDTD